MRSLTLHAAIHGIALTVLVFGLRQPLCAQATSTGLPFLTIPGSVESHALGHISSLPLSDPLSARLNPASAGLKALDVLVQAAFYAPATDWLPGFGMPITFSAQGGQAGFLLAQNVESRWALGVGFSRVYFDLGSFATTLNEPTPTSTYHGWEEAQALSAGLAYDGPVTFGAGASLTLVRSNLAPFGAAFEGPYAPARVNTLTLGSTVRVPVTRLLGLEMDLAGVTPFASVTSALVISDLGGSVSYGDQMQSDPLPRALTLGISMTAGARSDLAGLRLKLLEVELLREAQEILVERTSTPTPGWRYQAPPGDLRPFVDLFRQSGNTKVEHRKGFRMTFAESFTVSEGSFVDDGYSLIRTSGLGFSTRVCFLVLRSLTSGDGPLPWMLEHVSFAYAQASYEAERGHPLNGTDFQSITVTIHATNPHAAF